MMDPSPNANEDSQQSSIVSRLKRPSEAAKSVLLALLAFASTALFVLITMSLPQDWYKDATLEASNLAMIAVYFAIGLLLMFGISQAIRAFQKKGESKAVAALGLVLNGVFAIPIAIMIAWIIVRGFIWSDVEGLFRINGQPVGGAKVFLGDMSMHSHYRSGGSAVTRADGTFHIHSLWPADYQLDARYEIPFDEDPPICSAPSRDYRLFQSNSHKSVAQLRITANRPLVVSLAARDLPSFVIDVICK